MGLLYDDQRSIDKFQLNPCYLEPATTCYSQGQSKCAAKSSTIIITLRNYINKQRQSKV
jgi:hypothetical protein